jgi:hypothetical protein
MKLEFFSTDFRKILKYQISWNSVRWEPRCSMRTGRRKDEQTDITKVKSLFAIFANAPTNQSVNVVQGNNRCLFYIVNTERINTLRGQNVVFFNLLQPTCYVMHQQFNILTTVRTAHTVFMCFVFIWEQTATCAIYSKNWLVFITEMKSVYSAVRTGSLNKAVCASSLKS